MSTQNFINSSHTYEGAIENALTEAYHSLGGDATGKVILHEINVEKRIEYDSYRNRIETLVFRHIVTVEASLGLTIK